jgi:hypothetical protein
MSQLRHPLPTTLILTLAAVFLTLPALGMDLGGHDRDGVTVGLDLGAGWNKMKFSLEDAEGNSQKWETGSAVDFSGGMNVGWARNDYLIGSLGVYGWKEGGWTRDGNPISATTFHFLAEVHLFPRGQGFWIKGGLGAGTIDFSAVTPARRVTYQKGGWNFTAGAGYEFRVADTTAFGFAYDFRYLTVGAFEGLEDTEILSNNWSMSFRYYMD